jgi:hypothetical protein
MPKLISHATGPKEKMLRVITYESLVRHNRSYCEVGSIEQTDATPLVPEHQLLTWTDTIIMRVKVNRKAYLTLHDVTLATRRRNRIPNKAKMSLGTPTPEVECSEGAYRQATRRDAGNPSPSVMAPVVPTPTLDSKPRCAL